MERYLRAFNYYKVNAAGSANGQDNYFAYYVDRTPLSLVADPVPNGAAAYYITSYEWNSLSAWSVLRDVTIECSLPMNTEQYYVNPTNSRNSTSVFAATLTDLVPDISNGISEAGLSCNTFIYNSDNLNRIFELYGHIPIHNLQITVFFVDDQNNRYLLYTPQDQCVQLKLGFYHRSLIESLTDDDHDRNVKRRKLVH
jgi:hypothetical protein